MIANSNRSRRFGAEVAKNLRSLAIKSFPKDHVRRNGLRPPIAFYAALTIDVTHWGEKGNCRPRTMWRKRRASSEDRRPCLVRRSCHFRAQRFDPRREWSRGDALRSEW